MNTYWILVCVGVAWFACGVGAVLIQQWIDRLDDVPEGFRLLDDHMSTMFYFGFGFAMVVAWLGMLACFLLHRVLPGKRFTLRQWFSLKMS